MAWKIIEHFRALLKEEQHLIPPPKGREVRVALAFPQHYALGMSNLGFQVIFHRLSEQGIVWVERAFLPDPQDEQELQRSRRPLFSFETQRPLQEFHLLGFSISFEGDYLKFLRLLQLAQIPIWAHQRTHHHPLVIVGGAITLLNPEPIAPFVDCFVIGEGEEAVSQLIQVYQAHDGKRDQVLRELSKRPGFYVPSSYAPRYGSSGALEGIDPLLPQAHFPIGKHTVASLEDYPCHSVILTPNTEFSRMFLVEVTRGCPYSCSYCTVPAYSPFRNRHLDHLLAQIYRGLRTTRKIGLMGATVGNYRQIKELCTILMTEKIQLSVSSLRADALPLSLIQALAKGGARSITIAPETGTERLRYALNKRIKDEEILEAVEAASHEGIPHIKAYVMVGLPEETNDDLLAIVSLIRKMRQRQKKAFRSSSHSHTLSLSISPFVPKPHTPLARSPMVTEETLHKKISLLTERLRREQGLKVTGASPRTALVEGILARGDRRLAAVLANLAEKGESLSLWKRALQESRLPLEKLLYQEKEEPALPWDHLNPVGNRQVKPLASRPEVTSTTG